MSATTTLSQIPTQTRSNRSIASLQLPVSLALPHLVRRWPRGARPSRRRARHSHSAVVLCFLCTAPGALACPAITLDNPVSRSRCSFPRSALARCTASTPARATARTRDPR